MFGFFKKKNNAIELNAHMVGTVVELSNVPDEVFASKMLGDGLAIEPTEGVLYAPCDAEVVQVFPTKHAVGLKTNEGLEILLHIGIDTVQMQGEGFEAFVKEGDKVKKGDKLVAFDLNLVKEKAKSTITPMLITNMDVVEELSVNNGEVNANSVVANVKIKK
ncbi:PTS sugar transporter subunit IIA [Thermobrachium celere]|uniref:PTS system, glucose-specific IIA component n=1 Tax=Thermobrachium celere DSM 8682 TaxID=941824 RepID=R7RR88_9CLOT|nr:PTS glucose transporter subunit IIA [Thermobrachium celere]GFR34376.1 PTS glucose transporter subunit IIA [Thermobrachium celere]CDF58544.1 PTS system, glucose-specific IIA component [Thermobrachium celere DSM 8682]